MKQLIKEELDEFIIKNKLKVLKKHLVGLEIVDKKRGSACVVSDVILQQNDIEYDYTFKIEAYGFASVFHSPFMLFRNEVNSYLDKLDIHIVNINVNIITINERQHYEDIKNKIVTRTLNESFDNKALKFLTKHLLGKSYDGKHIRGYISKIELLPNPERLIIHLQYAHDNTATIINGVVQQALRSKHIELLVQQVRNDVNLFGLNKEVYIDVNREYDYNALDNFIATNNSEFHNYTQSGG